MLIGVRKNYAKDFIGLISLVRPQSEGDAAAELARSGRKQTPAGALTFLWPVTVGANYAMLQSGQVYMGQAIVNYPAKQVVLEIDNLNYQRAQ